MRLWPFLPVILLAWLVGSARADSAERRKACTSATAAPAAIPEIHADFERWRGRCVRLAGLLAERWLYADRAALTEPLDEAPSSRSIVVYPAGPGRAAAAPAMAEVVGTIGSCTLENAAAEALQAEHPDSIVWASGYCHTSLETYIRPTAIRRVSDRPVPRLTEAELPGEARPLVDAPAGVPGRDEHAAAARALAAAIARRDEAAFLRLTDPDTAFDLAGLEGRRPPGWLRRNRRDVHRKFVAQAGPGNAFGKLHRVGGRQERVLADRRDLAEASETGRLGRVVTCWCRRLDCSGRWPVLPSDADNDPRRPYACVRTNDYLVFRKGTYIQADASSIPRPFAEP